MQRNWKRVSLLVLLALSLLGVVEGIVAPLPAVQAEDWVPLPDPGDSGGL